MQTHHKKYLIFSLGAVLGLACALLVSTAFFSNFRASVISTFPAPIDCDVLMSPCSSALPTGETVTLSLSSTLLPTMMPITIEVSTDKLEPLNIIVEFSGVTMFMGKNQPTLVRKDKYVYTGKTVLPVCSKMTMPWEATVYIDTERGRIAAPFRFSVVQPTGSLSSTSNAGVF